LLALPGPPFDPPAGEKEPGPREARRPGHLTRAPFLPPGHGSGRGKRLQGRAGRRQGRTVPWPGGSGLWALRLLWVRRHPVGGLPVGAKRLSPHAATMRVIGGTAGASLERGALDGSESIPGRGGEMLGEVGEVRSLQGAAPCWFGPRVSLLHGVRNGLSLLGFRSFNLPLTIITSKNLSRPRPRQRLNRAHCRKHRYQASSSARARPRPLPRLLAAAKTWRRFRHPGARRCQHRMGPRPVGLAPAQTRLTLQTCDARLRLPSRQQRRSHRHPMPRQGASRLGQTRPRFRFHLSRNSSRPNFARDSLMPGTPTGNGTHWLYRPAGAGALFCFERSSAGSLSVPTLSSSILFSLPLRGFISCLPFILTRVLRTLFVLWYLRLPL
jgi:hypothetical protein